MKTDAPKPTCLVLGPESIEAELADKVLIDAASALGYTLDFWRWGSFLKAVTARSCKERLSRSEILMVMPGVCSSGARRASVPESALKALREVSRRPVVTIVFVPPPDRRPRRPGRRLSGNGESRAYLDVVSELAGRVRAEEVFTVQKVTATAAGQLLVPFFSDEDGFVLASLRRMRRGGKRGRGRQPTALALLSGTGDTAAFALSSSGSQVTVLPFSARSTEPGRLKSVLEYSADLRQRIGVFWGVDEDCSGNWFWPEGRPNRGVRLEPGQCRLIRTAWQRYLAGEPDLGAAEAKLLDSGGRPNPNALYAVVSKANKALRSKRIACRDVLINSGDVNPAKHGLTCYRLRVPGLLLVQERLPIIEG